VLGPIPFLGTAQISPFLPARSDVSLFFPLSLDRKSSLSFLLDLRFSPGTDQGPFPFLPSCFSFPPTQGDTPPFFRRRQLGSLILRVGSMCKISFFSSAADFFPFFFFLYRNAPLVFFQCSEENPFFPSSGFPIFCCAARSLPPFPRDFRPFFFYSKHGFLSPTCKNSPPGPIQLLRDGPFPLLPASKSRPVLRTRNEETFFPHRSPSTLVACSLDCAEKDSPICTKRPPPFCFPLVSPSNKKPSSPLE